MVKTFFILALVVLPLAVAVALIAYRVRYFVLGIVAIAVVTALIWAGIRLAAMLDNSDEARSPPLERTSISCDVAKDGSRPVRCGI
jgi:hypothetical protein